jgi:hypothetical protein
LAYGSDEELIRANELQQMRFTNQEEFEGNFDNVEEAISNNFTALSTASVKDFQKH